MEIDALIKDKIASVLTPTRDVYGDLTHVVSATNIECKFNDEPLLQYSLVGFVEIAKATAWVNNAATIDEGYEIVHNNKRYEVISVEKEISLGGLDNHKRVLLR